MPLKIAFLSEQARPPLVAWLRDRNIQPILLPPLPGLPAGVASHADLSLCVLDGQLWVVPSQYNYVMERLPNQARERAFMGQAEPGPVYPADVPYNAAVVGNRFIHKLDSTDPALLQAARDAGFQLIHTAQGYSKCSLVVVDGNSVITADRGLARTLTDAGLTVLPITPGHAALPGYPCGFPGGASGLPAPSTVLFHGDLSAHPDYAAILSFLEDRGRRAVFFPDFPLTDIGSILFWEV